MSTSQSHTTAPAVLHLRRGVAPRYGNLTIDRDSVDVRAQSRHLATVLTISGEIDARNTARISSYATALVPLGNALLLDLSGVGFIAAQSISVLIGVEDACRSTDSPWALFTSHAVDRVLRLSQTTTSFLWPVRCPTRWSISSSSRACADKSLYQRHGPNAGTGSISPATATPPNSAATIRSMWMKSGQPSMFESLIPCARLIS